MNWTGWRGGRREDTASWRGKNLGSCLLVVAVDPPTEGAVEQSPAEGDEKKKRRGRKKSKLEDMFPAYLQVGARTEGGEGNLRPKAVAENNNFLSFASFCLSYNVGSLLWESIVGP